LTLQPPPTDLRGKQGEGDGGPECRKKQHCPDPTGGRRKTEGGREKNDERKSVTREMKITKGGNCISYWV